MIVSDLCQDLEVFTIRHRTSQELAGLRKWSKTVGNSWFQWWACQDLNLGPIRYEGFAKLAISITYSHLCTFLCQRLNLKSQVSILNQEGD